MPAVDAPLADKTLAFFGNFFKTKTRGTVSAAVIALVFYLMHQRMNKQKLDLEELEKEADLFVGNRSAKNMGTVDKKFFKR
jgi:hypothetical protein